MKPRLFIAAAVISVIAAVPLTGALTHQADLQRVAQAKAYALQVQLVSQKKAEIAQAEQLKIEQAKKLELAAQAKAKADADAAAAQAKEQATLAYMTTPHCDAYIPLIEKYDWPVQTAVAIMKAESGCRAITPSNASINYDDVPDYGLFQLHGMDITDPAQNIETAYRVKYLPSHSFNAWNTYTGGQYRRYLQ